jgi:ketosteroid isomerase-like protein
MHEDLSGGVAFNPPRCSHHPPWEVVMPASPVHDAPAPITDAAALRSLEQNFVESFQAKDVQRIMSCFVPSEDLLVFDLSAPRQHAGYDAYTKDWQGFAKRTVGPLAVTMSDLVVRTDGGDLAYSHSIVHVAGKSANGRAMDHNARVTHVYQRVNGEWLIVHEHVSVPIDMATGTPDFQSKP